MKIFAVVIPLVLFFYVSAATTWYVSPQGSDANAGTSPEAPLLTLTSAISRTSAGDTILMRGGTYRYSSTISITKSGTAGKKYSLMAWPGETPVLNFSGTASGKRGISLTGSYWIIRGLTITLAGDNGMNISGGGYNLIENCTFCDNKDSGLQLGGGAHDNRIVNSDSFYNADPTDYGDADGFAPKLDVGSNNYFFGCRAWLNVDDGWDGYMRQGVSIPAPTTILENCWTWGNGYFKNWVDAGAKANGNGFKMGGSDDKILQHHFVVKNCLAFDNKAKGFDQNSNKGSMTVYNGTAFRNKGNDFSISTVLAAGQTATVKNSLVAQGTKVSLGTFVIQDANSWKGGFTVTAADFVSLDTTGVSGPRKADGSLPDLPFVHLAPGSNLIDAGIDVGLPFNGTKPDLGCFETGETTGITIPQQNKGDLFDLKVLNAGSSRIDISFDPDGEARFEYELWSIHGSLVWKSQEITISPVREAMHIDRSRIPAGVYLFRLMAGGRSQAVKIRLP